MVPKKKIYYKLNFTELQESSYYPKKQLTLKYKSLY